MLYPIAIEPGDENVAFGVVVPDLPGCFSAGDNVDDAIKNAKEAIELWLECVIDDGGVVPNPSTIGSHLASADYTGWIWAIVSIDLSELSEKRERINISVPRRVLRRIDAYAAAGKETRSGYLVRLALQDANPILKATESVCVAQASARNEKT